MKRIYLALLTFFLVVILDQWLKIWVKTNLSLGEQGADLGFIEIFFIENNGMAFGTELGGSTGKLLLSLFRMAAIVGICYYLYTLVKKQANRGLIAAIALILAGAFGNLIDSMFYGLIFSESMEYIEFFKEVIQPAVMFPEGGGYAPFLHGKVVDMLHFTVNWPEWVPYVGGDQVFPPVFNLADSAITAGVFMILIWQKRYFPKKLKSAPEVASESTEETQGEAPVVNSSENLTSGSSAEESEDKV